MSDWITHLAVAWTICMILGFRYKQFNASYTVIVLFGALIPDIYKIYLIGPFFGLDIKNLIAPIHLPIGSFLVAGMISLLFKEKKLIFLFFSLGIITHYCLDLLLENVSGGIYLFYPFYWGQWQFGLIRVDDYKITVITMIIAFLIYFYIQYYAKKNHSIN